MRAAPAVFSVLGVVALGSACTSLSGLSGPDTGDGGGGDDAGAESAAADGGGACTLPNATAEVTGGVCTVRACNPGYKDCHGGPADGCETFVQGGDLANCGDCAKPCAADHAQVSCDTGGTCTMGTCAAGFGDCNKNAGDGCETSIMGSDPAHCGSCTKACLVAQSCDAGACGDDTVTCSSAGVKCVQASCNQAGRYGVTADVVVDLQNGRRMWQRVLQAPAVYDVAALFCSNLVLLGLKSWRLPTYAELATLLYQEGGLTGCPTCDPATDQAAFPAVPSSALVWSSTPYMTGTYQAVNFCDGRMKYPTDITTPTNFRCVHDPI